MRAVGILWEGRSPVDGAPIVAIATDGSRNPKTGPMIQVWILRRDVPPHEAARDGRDASVCGACPLRYREGVGRACYVTPFRAPLVVWRCYRRGDYGRLRPEALRGRRVRWGAYGDPAMLPAGLVQACNRLAAGWSGYTHQWAQRWAAWTRGVFMASVETPRGESAARGRGWGTFRAGAPDGSDMGGAMHCPSDATGGAVTCAECGACDGRAHAVFIPAHGQGAGLVPAARLSRAA